MKTIAFYICVWIVILIFVSLTTTANAQLQEESAGFVTICGTEGCFSVQKRFLANLAVIKLRKAGMDEHTAVYMDILSFENKASEMGEFVPLVENFCLGRLYCAEFHCANLITDLWVEIVLGYKKSNFVDLTPVFVKHHEL